MKNTHTHTHIALDGVLVDIAEIRKDVMSRFHNSLYLGDVAERVQVLESTGQGSSSSAPISVYPSPPPPPFNVDEKKLVTISYPLLIGCPSVPGVPHGGHVRPRRGGRAVEASGPQC